MSPEDIITAAMRPTSKPGLGGTVYMSGLATVINAVRKRWRAGTLNGSRYEIRVAVLPGDVGRFGDGLARLELGDDDAVLLTAAIVSQERRADAAYLRVDAVLLDRLSADPLRQEQDEVRRRSEEFDRRLARGIRPEGPEFQP